MNGTFAVPSVMHSSTSPNESVAVWVGIDGYSNSQLIQTGILGENLNGTASYFAWYELLPNPAIKIPDITINPNDIIYTQIVLLNSTTNLWNIYLKDTSTGVVFSKNVFYYTPMQTAEWIVEAPTELSNDTVQTLAPFSTVQFSNAYLHVIGKTHNDVTAIGQKYPPKNPILINNTGAVQTYTSPILNGTSFSVAYIGTPANTSISTILTTTTIPKITTTSTIVSSTVSATVIVIVAILVIIYYLFRSRTRLH